MIRATRLLQHRFALAEPAADAKRVWSERRALLLFVEDGQGHQGVGEAAPLPGYSPDTLDDAWSALAPLVGRSLVERDLGSGSSRELIEATRALASPAARFALETALLDTWARQRSEPAWALLARLNTELHGGLPSSNAPGGLAVATLLPSGAARALGRAEQALGRGVRTFKLKLGLLDAWPEELRALQALRKTLGAVALRADANQSLTPNELEQRLPALRELRLEWLEEPCPASAVLPGTPTEPLGVPLALDESLQATAPEPSAAREQGVTTYVLKPTTLGGLTRTLELAASARRAGIHAVVSHAYEGPVAFTATAALALALGSGRPADGLDRHAALAASAAPNGSASLPALDFEHGCISPWSEPGLGLSPERAGLEITRELCA